jgi:xylulokinase
MTHLLGIDIGTTGAKTLLVDAEGRTVASAFSEWPMATPHPAWAEQDPEDWWRGTVASIREVLARSGVAPRDIAALGLSGQMHGLVLLDEADAVIRPSIIWCDQRTGAECAWIDRTVGHERLVAAISNPALPGFTAPKIIWVRDHEPEAFARARTMLLPKDEIRRRLTGRTAMEISDAAGTALFNVAEERWATEILGDLGLSADLLPPVIGSADVAGTITPEVAALTGLSTSTVVVGGGADNTCGAVGSGVVREGLALVSIGSSGVVLAPSVAHRMDPGLRAHTFNHSVPGLWYLMGVTQAAGLSLRWFRDQMSGGDVARATAEGRDPYDVMLEAAAGAPAGSRGVVWLPYLQGERTPHLDPDARAVLFGLTGAHTRADVIRAVLEGVAFSLRDCLSIVRDQGIAIGQVRLTGGGAKSPLWRQVFADVFGAELALTSSQEGPAFGAALMAAVGAGVFRSLPEACDATITVTATVEPDPAVRSAYDDAYALYRELYPALRPSFARVATIGARAS